MPLKIYIGFDEKEVIAYHVLAHSIMKRASRPVSITPLMLSSLKSIHTRPRSPNQSTDFTYTRFLTPFLSDYEGTSIFLDSDMLCLTDICELEDLSHCNPFADVLCVKHDYEPHPGNKFLNQPQTTYPCKNWSSMMVFNGWRARVRDLTPTYVNNASALDLHQFKWASEVVGLRPAWNHLVGEYAPNPTAKIIHFTLGGPYFKGYENCEYADAWFDELKDMLRAKDRSFDLVRAWL